MSEAEWKPLIYTCDWEGDYIQWDGRIFPNNVEEYIFDVRLKNGIVHFGCLVRPYCGDATAHAITQSGYVIKLEHGNLLRPAVVDKETEQRMRDAAFKLMVAENRVRRIKWLESRKLELAAELANAQAELTEVDAELAKLKKEAAK